MEAKVKELKVVNGKKAKIMEWPFPETKDKSWGASGTDRHFIN